MGTNAETLIFHDNFNSLTETWQHEVTMSGNGNREFEAYVDSPTTSYVDRGKLFLKPVMNPLNVESDALDLKPACQSVNWWDCFRQGSVENILPPVLSAKVHTKETFAFKYGRVEVRAKMPAAQWTWPAIWLMSQRDAYGGWPASGEIDVVESRGNEDYGPPGEPMGNNVFGSTLHWGPAFDKNGWPLTTNVSHPANLHDDFHTFGLYWSDTELFTYLDDETNVVTRIPFYGRQSFWDTALDAGVWTNATPNCWAGASPNAPFDQAFYIILNVAVGGTSPGKPNTDVASGYFPDDLDGKPWHTADLYPHTNFWRARASFEDSWTGDNAAMQIDDIKVWGFDGLTSYYAKLDHHQTPEDHLSYFLIAALAFFAVLVAVVVRRCSSSRSNLIIHPRPSYSALDDKDTTLAL